MRKLKFFYLWNICWQFIYYMKFLNLQFPSQLYNSRPLSTSCKYDKHHVVIMKKRQTQNEWLQHVYFIILLSRKGKEQERADAKWRQLSFMIPFSHKYKIQNFSYFDFRFSTAETFLSMQTYHIIITLRPNRWKSDKIIKQLSEEEDFCYSK